jgi:hypothetical protein
MMFDHERPLNEFLVRYLESLFGDVEDPELDVPPLEGLNPPRWIPGHLAISTDYALRSLGGRFHCPIDWHRSFARGTPGTSRPGVVPAKEALLEQIAGNFAVVRTLTSQADPDAMNRTHAIPFLLETPIKTVGDVVSHLMTAHFATHIGQLSLWRRAMGRGRVEAVDSTT